LAGDLTGYALGRRLGRSFLLEHGRKVPITAARLDRVEAFFARYVFARYGLATILLGRFVGSGPAIAPFLAGASRYPAGRFAVVATIGTGLRSGAFALLGLGFWQSVSTRLSRSPSRGSLTLGAVVLILVVMIAGYRHLRGRKGHGTGRPPTPQRPARPNDQSPHAA
jgi:membrane protein DedA with SNARE-associated domain